MKVCRMCDLCITRTNVVRGTGNTKADIMFIGESPNYHEDKSGVPFTGESGTYLRELLSKIAITEADIFITNIVKCRPPKNREPNSVEIKTCIKYFLSKEIAHVNPIFIVPVGKMATSTILNKQILMKDVVGRTFHMANRWIIPIYHPAHILRDDNLKEMYSKLIPYVINKIKGITFDYAFEIAATYNKEADNPF